MMTFKLHTLRIFLPLLLLTILGAGCLFNDPVKTVVEPVESYNLPPDTPQKLVDNFALCWEKMDLDHYAQRVLFSNELAVAVDDVTDYCNFEFFFLNPGVGGIPADPWFYMDEIDAIGRMFEGRDGSDPVDGSVIPSVDGITLTLEISPEGWTLANEGNAGVYNQLHPYPAGTWKADFKTTMVLTLSRENDGGFNAYTVDGGLEFWVIPVKGPNEGDPTEYRIWKWRDYQTL
ncbi:MAG: hypothetical protein GY835_14060 [bacterium]|nr:hypothetical protein [bacterium]